MAKFKPIKLGVTLFVIILVVAVIYTSLIPRDVFSFELLLTDELIQLRTVGEGARGTGEGIVGFESSSTGAILDPCAGLDLFAYMTCFFGEALDLSPEVLLSETKSDIQILQQKIDANDKIISGVQQEISSRANWGQCDSELAKQEAYVAEFGSKSISIGYYTGLYCNEARNNDSLAQTRINKAQAENVEFQSQINLLEQSAVVLQKEIDVRETKLQEEPTPEVTPIVSEPQNAIVGCQFKTITYVYSNNNIIDNTDVSKEYTDQVTLDVTGKATTLSGLQTIDTFGTRPFIQCDVNTNIPLIVKPTTVYVKVLSRDSMGNKIQTTFGEIRTIKMTLDDNHLHTFTDINGNIAEIKIKMSDILRSLDAGVYESFQEFQVYGNFELFFKDSFEVYRFSVPAVKTFYQVQVDLKQEELIINCGEGFILKNEKCVRAPIEITCPDNQVYDKTSRKCIPKDEQNGNVNPNPPSKGFLGLLSSLGLCLQTANIPCLMNMDFLPIYLLGFGGLFVIGAVAQRKQPDIYGVPYR